MSVQAAGLVYHHAFLVQPGVALELCLLDPTGEFEAAVQIELGQGGARLEHNDVTCGAMTAVGVFL